MKFKKLAVLLLGIFIQLCGAQIIEDASLQISATDSLGRTIATPAQVGNKSDKKVGVFYFVNNGFELDGPAATKVVTFDGVLNAGALNARLNPYADAWNATKGRRIYWGEPVFGFYRSNDPWAVRRNIQLLVLAGVDFMIFDYSNDEAGVVAKDVKDMDPNGAVTTVLTELLNMNNAGWIVPKVAFYLNSSAGTYAEMINSNFYANSLFSKLWYKVDGKNLIIARTTGDDPVSSVISSNFTVRESVWPNDVKPAYNPNEGLWPWIDWNRPQEVYTKNGRKDVMSVSPAQHPSKYMSNYPFYGKEGDWGRGYSYGNIDHSVNAQVHGLNFEEQWGRALSQDMPQVFVTSWNEGGAYREIGEENENGLELGLLGWSEAHDVQNFGKMDDGGLGGDVAPPNVLGGTRAAFIYSSALDAIFHPELGYQDYLIRVKYHVDPKNGCTGPSVAKIYWTDELEDFSEPKSLSASVPCAVNGEYQTDYRVHTYSSIRRMRFDVPFVREKGGQFSVKSIDLDVIAQSRMGEYVAETKSFAFASRRLTDGWNALNSNSKIDRGYRGTLLWQVDGNDCAIQSPLDLGYSFSGGGVFRIRIRNSTDATMMRLLLNLKDGKSYVARFNVERRNSSFQIVEIDAVGLFGVGAPRELTDFIIDVPGAASGKIELDYVRIGSSNAEMFPGLSYEFAPKHFIWDAAGMEFSRDIEPSNGLLGDNYYLQFCDFVRKLKGADELKVASSVATPYVVGDFSKWATVSPVYRDFNDVQSSRKLVVGSSVSPVDNVWINTSSGSPKRIGIIECKAARDGEYMYFYVKATADISFGTASTLKNFMTLYLDVDGDHTNGWLGYDYVINRVGFGVLERCAGGNNWVYSGNIDIDRLGGQMQVKVRRGDIGLLRDPIDLQFKWYLGSKEVRGVRDFYRWGDAAPDGRFNYVYVASSQDGLPAHGKPIASMDASSVLPTDQHDEKGFYLTFDETQVGEIVITPRISGRNSSGFPRDFKFQYRSGWTWYDIPGMIFENYQMPGHAPQRFTLKSPIWANGIRWMASGHRYGDNADAIFAMSHSRIDVYGPAKPVWDRKGLTQWTFADKWPLATPLNVVAGQDPDYWSPDYLNINVSKDESQYIHVRLRNSTPSNKAQIYYSGSDGVLSEEKSVTFDIVANDGNLRDYWVRMNWDALGKVRRLRIIMNKRAQSGSFDCSLIELKDATSPMYQWTFANGNPDANGWNGPNSMSELTWSPKGRLAGVISGLDPHVWSDVVNWDINGARYIKLKMKNGTADKFAQVYYSTSGLPFDEIRSVRFPVVPNDDRVREYVVDMRDAPYWNGVLNQLRLDPCVSCNAGTFEVENIGLYR